MTRARTSLVLAAVVLALLGAGCGIAANHDPQVIASDDLPTELLDPNPSTSTTVGLSPTDTSITVYFLQELDSTTRLVGVPRVVKDASRARDRITALLAPPTSQELAEGLLTSIPADTRLLDSKLNAEAGELVIDLSTSLFDIQGQELRNAFAQLVWTATDMPGVRQVRFLVAGKEYRVPDEDGIEQPGAVSRLDYATLAPVDPNAATTTTVPLPPGGTTVPATDPAAPTTTSAPAAPTTSAPPPPSTP